MSEPREVLGFTAPALDPTVEEWDRIGPYVYGPPDPERCTCSVKDGRGYHSLGCPGDSKLIRIDHQSNHEGN